MVMSYAYVVSFTGVGMSDAYMLKRMGDQTPPCGIPLLNWRYEVLFLNVVFVLCALM